MHERDKSARLINDRPYVNGHWFSIGTLKSTLNDEGKFAGPAKHYIETVELYVNPGNPLRYHSTCTNLFTFRKAATSNS